jgi:hypoxanthine-guanine phosphoribosyltransferase
LRSQHFLVDDFVGQGGTLANLRGFVESRGAKVLGATSLTGKGYSAKLRLTEETLQGLKGKHGTELEQWWVAAFGYGFERLTESEARYLTRADDAHSISARIVAATRK